MIKTIKIHKQGIIRNKFWWCAFIVGLLMSNYGYTQSVSISPSRMFFSGNAGQELSQQLTLVNTGSSQVIFKASLMDWERDSTGDKHFYQPGTKPLSDAAWVEVMPNLVEIAPGAKQQITVTMHVPKDLPGNDVHNAMLFLSQINEQKANQTLIKSSTIGVLVKFEFGVHIYYTPQGANHKDLDFISFNNQGVKMVNKENVRRVAVKIKSLGNVITDGFLNFEVTNKTTGDEFKVSPKAISMLPGAEQIIYLDLPLTLTGHYLLVALLDGGEETNLKVAKKEVDFGN